MYANVTELAIGLLSYANNKGLTSVNPITLNISDSVTGYQTIRFIVAFSEPHTSVMPLDLMWLVTDNVSPNYNKILRRVNRTPADGNQHTWVEVTTLSTAWTAQSWDTSIPTDQFAHDHADNIGNPHQTTAADVGAVPTTGGTLTGALIPRPKPGTDYLSTEVVPRSWIDAILGPIRSAATFNKTFMNNLNNQFINLRGRTEVLEASLTGFRTLVYTPPAPALIWTVVHTFNKANVLVEVFDTNNEKVIPGTIKVLDNSTVEIHFALPFTGRAEISPKTVY